MKSNSVKVVLTDVYRHKTRCKSAPTFNYRSLQQLEEVFVDKSEKKKINYTIEELHELITDQITEESKPWIDRLLTTFLDDIKNNEYRVKDLPAVMQVLEFLSWKAREVPEYQKHLDKMLDLCSQPPRFQKPSEKLSSSHVIEHYFSLLGYMIVILPNHLEITKVLNALCQLLTTQKSADISTVKLEDCQRAVERSKLPVIIADLVAVCTPEISKKLLNLTWIIASISDECCHQMLELKILDHLLIKLSEMLLSSEAEECVDEKIQKDVDEIVSILWTLMNSIVSSANTDNFLPKPEAMESLRRAFNISVRRSESLKSFITTRNDLIAVILAGLVAFPSWPLVGSGLAEDLITLAASAKTPKINEDVFFQKTLQYILCHQANCGASISIMEDKRVVSAILENLVMSHSSKVSWALSEGSGLVQSSLRTLQCLVPRLPGQFINSRGASKIVGILESCVIVEINTPIVQELMRTVCLICSSKDTNILKDFLETDIVQITIKLINCILNLEELTTQSQKILTFSLMNLEMTMDKEVSLLENHGEQLIEMTFKLLQRCISPRSRDFLIDQRLLIAMGSFIWQCIVWCPMNLKQFVDEGGAYMILDLTEKSNLHVQNVYLGVLADMCSGSNCIPHLCTWRGLDKSKGLLSLLAKIWREEEAKIGVKRTLDGCIEDVELPLMGTDQWQSTFQSRITFEFSPALSAMFGSVRPKIYSIRQMLITNSEIYNKIREHYKILLDDLPMNDSITLCVIDRYLRLVQGQVWAEVLRYLKQNGVIPLGSDGEILLVMRQRHRACGLHIQERQEKIINDAKKKELQLEIYEFAKIRETKLAAALEAVKEMEFIRKTIDHSYRKEKKESNHQQKTDDSKSTDINDDLLSLVSPQSSGSINSAGFSTSVESYSLQIQQ